MSPEHGTKSQQEWIWNFASVFCKPLDCEVIIFKPERSCVPGVAGKYNQSQSILVFEEV